MDHYMINNPEKTDRGHRSHFSIVPLNKPSTMHCQWDDGDCTSRALDAWLFARIITGNQELGRDVEEGQWRYLQSLFHPENGLICVADHNRPGIGYYCHLWDQGRTLRHLINRYQLLSTDNVTRVRIKQLISGLFRGLDQLSLQTDLGEGHIGRYWVFDAYWNGQPTTREMDFGSCHFTNFAIGSAQFLDPAVTWAVITGDLALLDWAVQLADGFVAGLEKRREGTLPMFGDNGRFYGHFHTVASGLTGLVHLATELHRQGQTALSRYYLDIVIRSYRWIFSPENPCRGSSYGWFPENSGKKAQPMGEICCIADMIELAAALAGLAFKITGYADLDSCWDDVDRFTTNELCMTQTTSLEKHLAHVAATDKDAFLAIAPMYLGGWTGVHEWPECLACPPGNQVGGCCLYSGPRGFYACWKSIVSENDSENTRHQSGDHHIPSLEIRFPGKYISQAIQMDLQPEGGLSFIVSQPSHVSVRIPTSADKDSVRVLQDGKAIPETTINVQNRIKLHAQAGLSYHVSWSDLAWTSIESLVMEHNPASLDYPDDAPITYQIEYRGNRLTGVKIL
jgi:hypothetical protein